MESTDEVINGIVATATQRSDGASDYVKYSTPLPVHMVSGLIASITELSNSLEDYYHITSVQEAQIRQLQHDVGRKEGVIQRHQRSRAALLTRICQLEKQCKVMTQALSGGEETENIDTEPVVTPTIESPAVGLDLSVVNDPPLAVASELSRGYETD